MFFLCFFLGFFCLMFGHALGSAPSKGVFGLSRLSYIFVIFIFFFLENSSLTRLWLIFGESKELFHPFLPSLCFWNQSLLLSLLAPLVFFLALYNQLSNNILKITNKLLFFFILNSYFFLLTDNLGIFFLSFEGLLLVSLALLRLTSKSDRALEAISEMFF